MVGWVVGFAHYIVTKQPISPFGFERICPSFSLSVAKKNDCSVTEMCNINIITVDDAEVNREQINQNQMLKDCQTLQKIE